MRNSGGIHTLLDILDYRNGPTFDRQSQFDAKVDFFFAVGAVVRVNDCEWLLESLEVFLQVHLAFMMDVDRAMFPSLHPQTLSPSLDVAYLQCQNRDFSYSHILKSIS